MWNRITVEFFSRPQSTSSRFKRHHQNDETKSGFSGSCLVKALVLIELGVKTVVYHGGEKLVKLWEGTDRFVVFWFCRVLLLVDPL